jgi:hypothetical protein
LHQGAITQVHVPIIGTPKGEAGGGCHGDPSCLVFVQRFGGLALLVRS